MLRVSARPLVSSLYRLQLAGINQLRARSTAADASEEELQEARKWLEQVHAETIPKDIGELSFSRSSGPGGQNVNK
jgi:peptidyl-tRNA hydrolase ICT1